MEYHNNMYLEVSGKANQEISPPKKMFYPKISPVLGNFPSAGRKFQDI